LQPKQRLARLFVYPALHGCTWSFVMNRTEMVDIISRQRSLDAPVVDDVLRAFLELVLLSLAVGEPVTIRGFGRFDQKLRPSAHLKHPRTGAPIETGERRTISFRPSKKAKVALNPSPLSKGTDPNRLVDLTPSDSTVASDGNGSPPIVFTATSGAAPTTITV
jgi:DNA-binding protein HU-beta